MKLSIANIVIACIGTVFAVIARNYAAAIWAACAGLSSFYSYLMEKD